jgi:hypothetical protein
VKCRNYRKRQPVDSITERRGLAHANFIPCWSGVNRRGSGSLSEREVGDGDYAFRSWSGGD